MSNPPKSSLLQDVASLIEKKHYQAASELLIPFISKNPQSEEGWFLLSYSIQDRQKKIECLQRVIQINPNNERAKTRLARLQAIPSSIIDHTIVETPQGEEIKQTKRQKKQHWSLYIIALLIIVLIGIISVNKIIPSFSPSPDQEETNTAYLPPEEKPIPRISPSITHTSHPTATPTNYSTPTATPTTKPPTPTRDLPTPTGQLAQEMDDIQNQVSTIRGLGILVDSPRYIIQQSKVHSILSKMFAERYTRDEVNDEARVLNALGLIDPSYDLYDKLVGSIDEGLNGFYIPWTDELFIIGDEFTGIEKFVYAHEYDHALTDQYYHLENIGVYPECIRETDQCNAISALVEGDASYLMYQWLDAYASEDEIAEINDAQFVPVDQVISSSDFPPPYVIRDIYFKYFDGRNFVGYLLEQGDWDFVNSAYSELPVSSEQILHPEKYISRETPIEVDLIPLDNILGDDWRLLTTETLGELTTEMILGYSSNYLVQLDPITSASAATGWGGDRYQVFYRSRSNQTILVANWIWDNIDDRNEFLDGMKEYLNRRYVGRKITETDFDCWTKINDQFSCLVRMKLNTLWVLTPTWDLMTLILDQYPDFK